MHKSKQGEEDRERYQAELLATYDDVLSNELKLKLMNTHGPMRIRLMRGGKSYRTATARRVPLRFEKQVDKTLDKLKRMEVITEVNEPTAWCSPAFYNNVRVRLVMVVKQPIYPFPCTTEILQAIPANTRVFAKLDAVHGTSSWYWMRNAQCLQTFSFHKGSFDISVARWD